MNIPQTDPRSSYLRHKSEIDAAIGSVLSRGQYILGPEVQAFEQEFAAFAGARHAVAVANGTDALAIGLIALGVEPGDAVITVSHTAVATVAAIEMIGAVPVLADVDRYFCLDPDSASDAVKMCIDRGLRVGAIVPVHLYGQPADLEALARLAESAGAYLLEDCSQAHGAVFSGRMVGRFGQLAAFSCYPTKNLGAIGDAGVVTTDSQDVAERVAATRQYGWQERFISSSAGRNSRLDELQAAILRVKLRTLTADNGRRAAIASAYDAGLRDSGLALPSRRPDTTHVWHQYVVRLERRDELKAQLAAAGIGTGIHYPVPVHLQPAYMDRVLMSGKSLRATEKAATEILSLPMYPELPDDDVQRVIEALRIAVH